MDSNEYNISLTMKFCSYYIQPRCKKLLYLRICRLDCNNNPLWSLWSRREMSIFCRYCSFDLCRNNVILGSSTACSLKVPATALQMFGVHIQWTRDLLLSQGLQSKRTDEWMYLLRKPHLAIRIVICPRSHPNGIHTNNTITVTRPEYWWKVLYCILNIGITNRNT
jgi:hypothetical protein